MKVFPTTFLAIVSCVFLGVAQLPLRASDGFLSNGSFEDWEPASEGIGKLMVRNAVETSGGEVPVGWTIGQSIRDGSDHSPETFGSFARDEEVKQEGLYSLRLEKKNNLYGMGIASRGSSWNPSPIELQPGKSYILRGWIKGKNLESSSSSAGNVRLIIAREPANFFSDGNPRRNVSAKLPDIGTFDDWTEFELLFDMNPEETACFIQIGLNDTVTGTVWLDGLTLTEQ